MLVDALATRDNALSPEHAQATGEQRTYNEHAHCSGTNGRGRVVAVLVGWAQHPLCYTRRAVLRTIAERSTAARRSPVPLEGTRSRLVQCG